MKIEITQEDLDRGREKAKKRCGCAIWHSVVRQLQIPESQAEELVSLPNYETVKLGNTEFSLPPEAVSMQRVLVEYPLAHVEPFSFDAPVRKYDDPEDSESSVVEVEPKKPSLLERLLK